MIMKKIIFFLFFIGLFANAQIVNIPDAAFKARLLSASPSNQIASTQTPVFYYDNVSSYNTIDTNNDGEIQLTEAEQIKYLVVSGLNSADLTGLESFSNLKILICTYNPQLTNLDVSNLNQLINLVCFENHLTNLDVSNLLQLKSLACKHNFLTLLDVHNNSQLEQLQCQDNLLQSLNLVNLVNLRILFCQENQLNSLYVYNTPNLESINCSNNYLTVLDCEDSPLLETLFCSSNQLDSLFIKTNENNIISNLSFDDNPNLNYICADNDDMPSIQNLLNLYGYSNSQLNSYCTFIPAGNYNTVYGEIVFDMYNNGCDLNDIRIPNINVSVNDNFTNSFTLTNINGQYIYYYNLGNVNFSLNLENPSYFNVSPLLSSYNFTTLGNIQNQDYCIAANGTHHDLEVVIFPVNIARPGFDAAYKITYKNKGTYTENATLNFLFDDAVLDFVSASTTATTQNVGNLVWDLGALAPFQSGEIIVTLNLNAPTETPALNSGDVLNYSATINGAFADETPTDNVFDMPQVVVNSYDPNDKTCLNGTTISTDNIGEYIYYMIRFENTGTFPAQNIVVKDMIDIAKFDVNSLQMVNASHNCYTKRTGNKVEFIFGLKIN
jgi:hypothetical protein